LIVRKIFEEKFKKYLKDKLSFFNINIPKNKNYGDISTDFLISIKDDDLRENILNDFKEDKNFEEVNFVKPGFLNLKFSKDFYKFFLKKLLVEKDNYLKDSLKNDKKIQIEFVSANPTGPLTLGNGRNAAIGDALSNTMKYLGMNVFKEYYLNDAGKKIDLLVASVYLRIKELRGEKIEFLEDGYKGEYIYEIAKKILEKNDENIINNMEYLREEILKILISSIEKDLNDFGVNFDNWFSEKKMRDRGEVQFVLNYFKEKGFSYEKDGAIWFKSKEFGDEKDRVLVKSDGEYTYFLTDITYHLNKWNRGFRWIIDIWGWDHIGHIMPLKWALKVFGIEEDFLTVILYQIVHLIEGGKEVKMSKTKGEFVTLRELVDEIGKDTVRFIFLSRSSESMLNFDLDIARKKSLENPVYYIQYAYTRARSIERKRLEKNINFDFDNIDLNFNDDERELINKLIYVEETLYQVVNKLSPHLLAFQSYDIAKKFHSFYHDYPVLNLDNDSERNKRICLVKGVEITLSLLLNLIGVSTPEEM